LIALIQRVAHARVDVDQRCTGAIERGVLALIGVQPGDGAPQRRRMLAELLLGYRIFEDEGGR
jgi:D-tyrosyl-tRNA(Tyr) deacylase